MTTHIDLHAIGQALFAIHETRFQPGREWIGRARFRLRPHAKFRISGPRSFYILAHPERDPPSGQPTHPDWWGIQFDEQYDAAKPASKNRLGVANRNLAKSFGNPEAMRHDLAQIMISNYDLEPDDSPP